MTVSYSKLNPTQFPKLFEISILNNATKILITDDNIKPIHIAIPAQFTEFHICRNSDTLLLNIGESWTYGEALKNIGTGIGKFDFKSQLEGCFGPRICEVTGWDLYQFAIPGNCNLYMHLELDRILKHISTLGYKKVYVAMQMTEPSRELPIAYTDIFKNYPKLKKWYDYPKEVKISLLEWLTMYDEIFFDHFNNSLNNFTACPIEGIMWRNFTKISSPRRDYNFKFIEPTWIEYTAKLMNFDYEPPYILNAIEIDSYAKNIGINLKLPKGLMDSELDKISKMFDYIGGNNHEGRLIYHNNHPTMYGHLVWAHHLIRQAGWKDI
jgi:hypothetical protein